MTTPANDFDRETQSWPITFDRRPFFCQVSGRSSFLFPYPTGTPKPKGNPTIL